MVIDDLSTSFFRSNWDAGIPPRVRDQLLDCLPGSVKLISVEGLVSQRGHVKCIKQLSSTNPKLRGLVVYYCCDAY
jgi:hypothetical protein